MSKDRIVELDRKIGALTAELTDLRKASAADGAGRAAAPREHGGDRTAPPQGGRATRT